MITEKVFGMQGLGALLIDAVASSDLPVVVGCTVFAGLLIVLANLARRPALRLSRPTGHQLRLASGMEPSTEGI